MAATASAEFMAELEETARIRQAAAAAPLGEAG